MNKKNYNSTRDKLILPEYGRNVVFMVEELLKIENRDERSRQAALVIEVMGNINPTLRDSAAYSHKLWDHLYVLSDFKLEIDSPYEKPVREDLEIKPERIPYQRNNFSHKQYGNNVRKVIEALKEEEDKELVEIVAIDIAKFMRQKSYEFNQEYPSNEVVINDIATFSGGEIRLEEDALDSSHVFRNKAKNTKSTIQKNGQNTVRSNTIQRRTNGSSYGTNQQGNNQQRKKIISFKKK